MVCESSTTKLKFCSCAMDEPRRIQGLAVLSGKDSSRDVFAESDAESGRFLPVEGRFMYPECREVVFGFPERSSPTVITSSCAFDHAPLAFWFLFFQVYMRYPVIHVHRCVAFHMATTDMSVAAVPAAATAAVNVEATARAGAVRDPTVKRR